MVVMGDAASVGVQPSPLLDAAAATGMSSFQSHQQYFCKGYQGAVFQIMCSIETQRSALLII